VYERVQEQFSEDELVHLSLAIVAINGWNRLNIAARTVPGGYVAGSLAKVSRVELIARSDQSITTRAFDVSSCVL